MSIRALVVDDEPAIRELLAEYLRGRGLTVDAVSDGEDACARLANSPPDVVITDLKLPGVDGIVVVRAAAAAGVPAVLMAGYRTVDTAIESHGAGAHAYILKPFRLSDVHATLERARADGARQRRRDWAERAFALTVDAAEAADAAEADALVPRLLALVRALPGRSLAAVHDAPGENGAPLGAARWIDAPHTREAHVLVNAVHAALLRAGR
jgi:DNA-binding NtrC family response regulator